MTEPWGWAEPARLAVVVPAHDEEDRIADCLHSVARARGHRRLGAVHTSLVVVLDRCSDRTAEVTGSLLGRADRMVSGSWANVGAARRAGMAVALAAADGWDPGAVVARHHRRRYHGAPGLAGPPVVVAAPRL